MLIFPVTLEPSRPLHALGFAYRGLLGLALVPQHFYFLTDSLILLALFVA
jgi:hypothetical protein